MSAPAQASSASSNVMKQSCCTDNPKVWPYLQELKTICCIAGAVFAVMTAPAAFGTFFGIGAALQLITIYNFGEKGSKTFEGIPGGCGGGVGELFGGIEMVPYETILLTAALAIEHIPHNPTLWVPIVGFYVGKNFSHTAWTLAKGMQGHSVTPVVNPIAKPQSCCHAIQ